MSTAIGTRDTSSPLCLGATGVIRTTTTPRTVETATDRKIRVRRTAGGSGRSCTSANAEGNVATDANRNTKNPTVPTRISARESK